MWPARRQRAGAASDVPFFFFFSCHCLSFAASVCFAFLAALVLPSFYDSTIMKPGMVFTIEPILVVGPDPSSFQWPDGWTMVLWEKTISAQHEETILITEDGAEVLTAHELCTVFGKQHKGRGRANPSQPR